MRYDSIKLKVPLPHHRKTVHDFIFLTQGSMSRSIGAEVFEAGTNTVFLLPAGSITSTTMISADIDGYYCHFAPSFLASQPMPAAVQKLFDNLSVNYQPVAEIPNNLMLTLSVLLQRIESCSGQIHETPFLRLGWRDDFLTIWLGDFLIGCCLSVPTGFTVVPLIKRWVDSMTDSSRA
jgi:hypothetical protein